MTEESGAGARTGDTQRGDSAQAIRGSVWLLATAVVICGVAILMGVRTFSSMTAAPTAQRDEAVVRRDLDRPAVRPRPSRPDAPPQRNPVDLPELRDSGNAPEKRFDEEIDYSSAAAYLEAAGAAAREAHARGVPLEGIWAFPPAGTKPVLPGVVVPDDFELPPGYVRHYQSTDDGKALEPILMYHPDHAPIGEDGRPLQDPEDLVVPPEDVPSGIPVVILDVPEATFDNMQGGNPVQP